MYKYRHHEDESFKHNIKTRTQCLLGNTSKNIMMKSELLPSPGGSQWPHALYVAMC